MFLVCGCVSSWLIIYLWVRGFGFLDVIVDCLIVNEFEEYVLCDFVFCFFVV